MGIVHLPAINDNWSRETHTRYALIADKIFRQRFRDIFRYLHFVDNDRLAPRDDPSYDRLGKVRPLINHLSERFEKVYQLTRNVAVEEAISSFWGGFPPSNICLRSRSNEGSKSGYWETVPMSLNSKYTQARRKRESKDWANTL